MLSTEYKTNACEIHKEKIEQGIKHHEKWSERYEKEPDRIIRNEKYNVTIKHSIDKLNGGLHTTEDKINGLEDQEKPKMKHTETEEMKNSKERVRHRGD